MSKIENIRNFCIIAHIDHGKSTLADRLIEYTGAVKKRDMSSQFLDQMDLEKERGITIKLQAIKMTYTSKKEETFLLNLIDTPGHVDFSYEVSRSLVACEGALLVVDASQGIEAQTLANVYLAIDNNLEIIPVINKIDLPSADPERVCAEIKDVIGLDISNAIFTSAKTGKGTEAILEAIIKIIPCPEGRKEGPLKALIFDSHFDAYKGALSYVRVVDGIIKKGMNIQMMSTKHEFEVTEVGVFEPYPKVIASLETGEVGYVAASIKKVSDTNVGDTITDVNNIAKEALSGYKKAVPMVYCGLYPIDTKQYNDLRDSLEKLKLNDASLTFDFETSTALGFGFRCGFLGLLHMEIIQERLEREYNIQLIATAPNVIFNVYKLDDSVISIDNPSQLPSVIEIDHIEEPIVKGLIMVPSDYVGAVMKLCQKKRGKFVNMDYTTQDRVLITYWLPLGEIIYDFFNQLKSRTKGYASFDYEIIGHETSNLVKLDVLLAGEIIDALSCIVHKDKAYYRGRSIVAKLHKLIPRQLFEVPIQVAIGTKIIARETVKAIRKDVLEKCYGGDISRKKKLLEKQKEGKKKMKQIGRVEVPQEVFMAVLCLGDE